jgi:hypothetical protein
MCFFHYYCIILIMHLVFINFFISLYYFLIYNFFFFLNKTVGPFILTKSKIYSYLSWLQLACLSRKPGQLGHLCLVHVYC